MAHDPSLGFADYFSAADAAAASSLMPQMDEGAPELYGLQSGMELLGMRGLHAAAMSEPGDGGGDGHDGSTMRFFLEQQQQQQQHLHHQHHQPSRAPLSLSLCRPEEVAQLHQQQHHHHLGGSSQQQQQHEVPVATWMLPQEQDAAAYAHGHGVAWPLRSSRFLAPAQQLLQGYCSLPVDITPKRAKPQQQDEAGGGEVSSSSTSGWTTSPQIQAMDALELKRLKDRLYVMLEEADRIAA